IKEIKIKLIVYNINKKVVEIICIKLRISTEPKTNQPCKVPLLKLQIFTDVKDHKLRKSIFRV
ncbi:hypothetical protein, partial [Methanosarcina sp. 2.H.A.1B.4]|uniref:hypothetical protein n=1 Tax=Methanosarcina sp. 2.H.A.1B.4 TaxID=1483600 RepID=UPI000A8CA859